VFAGFGVSASVVWAQTNMLSGSNPVLMTSDGVPDGTGDSAVTATHTIGAPGTLSFATCDGPFDVDTHFTGPVVTGFSRPGQVPEFTVQQQNTSDALHPRPVLFHYDELAQGFNTGDLRFIDTDGDNRYERVDVTGDANSNPVAFTMDLLFYDGDSDGFPNFVTFALPPPFNGGILSCGDQAWFPVAHDLQNDPAVVLDLNGDSAADPEFLWGPKFDLLFPTVLDIPTLSNLSIAVFAVLLLLAGLRLARRRGQSATGA
jgi:hypothetical protein